MVVMAVGIGPRLPTYKPCLLTTTLLQLTLDLIAIVLAVNMQLFHDMLTGETPLGCP